MRRLKPGWRLLILSLLLGWWFHAPEASAEVFHTGRTLKPRVFSLGIEPQLVLKSPVGAELNLHGGIGIVRGLDFGLTYTLPLPGSNLPQRLGLDLEAQLLHDSSSSPAISISLGGHVLAWQQYGLDATLMISKVLGRIEPYLAVDSELSLPPYAVEGHIRLVGGVDFHVSRSTEILLEFGWGVLRSESVVSLGLNFYI